MNLVISCCSLRKSCMTIGSQFWIKLIYQLFINQQPEAVLWKLIAWSTKCYWNRFYKMKSFCDVRFTLMNWFFHKPVHTNPNDQFVHHNYRCYVELVVWWNANRLVITKDSLFETLGRHLMDAIHWLCADISSGNAFCNL